MIIQLEVQPETAALLAALLNDAKRRGISIDALLRETLETAAPPQLAASAKLQRFLEEMAADSNTAPVLPAEANERAFYYEGQD